MNKAVCEICPHRCRLGPNQVGLCRARGNVGGLIKAINYGLITSLALDPIEKKPLYHFHQGSMILSIGSFGCNLRCPFCQNWEISTATKNGVGWRELSPRQVVRLALELRSRGNVGIAYTYNEPLVGYEFVYDCAELAHEYGLHNVLVSNGYCCREPLEKLLPLINAVNFDLKAFNDQFYRKVGGDLETVKRAITLAAEYCHVEVTTLVIPGENDTEAEIQALARWLAGVRRDIPLHLTRFFPRYKYQDQTPTDVSALHKLADLARMELEYVYLGNC
ncbi:MAG: AmmeMemoRadiSam system radical SAM enzyme [Bacillota bacterium]|nr:AmmeMemoRadiSam system radical SAM enzyme [Bacillota bacterium]NLL88484.1 AmmeMemoRadiSam system radical SAM enzyme [Bacillota bacterium]